MPFRTGRLNSCRLETEVAASCFRWMGACARTGLVIAAALWSAAAVAQSNDADTGAETSLAVDCSAAVSDQASAGSAAPYDLAMIIFDGNGQLAEGETVTVARLDGSDSITEACTSPEVHFNLAPGSYAMGVEDAEGYEKEFLFSVKPAEPSRKLLLFFAAGRDV